MGDKSPKDKDKTKTAKKGIKERRRNKREKKAAKGPISIATR